MAKRMVVTGAAGFIGSHVCEALVARGHEVVGVDCFTDYYDVAQKRANIAALTRNPRFHLLESSLNDIDLAHTLKDAEVVFHLAAQAGVRKSWGSDFEHYIEHNIRATQRLCEAMKGTGIRLVYSSSSSVYGETEQLPMREDHPTRPRSPYGVTKLAGETLCLLYGANHGLPVACLRYFTVYGPRQRPDMAFHRFIKAAIAGDPVDVYGTGQQTRDFTFISDAVAANLAAAAYAGNATVFNIGGGSRASLNTVIDLIGRVTGRTLDVRYREPQPGDVTHTYADISLAARELGYAPAVGLEEGIRREVEWLDAQRRGVGI
jgi:nucleoside-diphosphate-sugar epimerase